MKASQLTKIKELRTLYRDLNKMTPWKDYRGKLEAIQTECSEHQIPTHLVMMEQKVFELILEKSGLLDCYHAVEMHLMTSK